ncbi:MAG: polysaccharide deacetylase family protein [Candidatus Obscuribacterales bacterium]|nr:polysaccharide deacetylase family protein [Steroidobacteraceae bacterium]
MTASPIKGVLATSLYYSGIAWLYFALAFRRKGVVLMYHRVLPADQATNSFSAGAIVVTPATFESHMRFLRRHCNPVDAQQFSLMMSGKKPWLPRTCLVTFDDGWADNAEHALPILARHKVPAVVFLATAYVGTEECFWQEKLTRLLYEVWTTGAAAQELFADLNAAELISQPEPSARENIRHVVTALKTNSSAALALLRQRIEHYLRQHPSTSTLGAADRFMSWSQALMLQQSGLVTLGSHAHSHTPLTMLPAAEVRAELESAQTHIAKYLSTSPTLFAYPNGDHNYGVAKQVQTMGYHLAFTTVAGSVEPGDDPFTIRRMNISERGTSSAHGFLCRLLGWF